MVCLALETGRRLWEWDCAPAVVEDGFLYDDRYYVLLASGEVCVLALQTGQLEERLGLQREATCGMEPVRVTRPLLVSETHVWTGSLQGFILAFERFRGGFAWSHRPDGGGNTDIQHNSFVVANGYLYYADESARVYCMGMTETL